MARFAMLGLIAVALMLLLILPLDMLTEKIFKHNDIDVNRRLVHTHASDIFQFPSNLNLGECFFTSISLMCGIKINAGLSEKIRRPSKVGSFVIFQTVLLNFVFSACPRRLCVYSTHSRLGQFLQPCLKRSILNPQN